MSNTTARSAFLAVAATLPGLVAQITDPRAPGLGRWSVGSLAGHLLRALRTPLRYLETDPAPDIALGGPAAYFAAYLDWRSSDPETADESVAMRGDEELPDASPQAILGAYQDAVAELEVVIPDVPTGFVVASPFGGIAFDDYLPTRTFEAVVHGTDLARALGIEWQAPAPSLRASLDVMIDLAINRGVADELLMVLTGRTVAAPTLLR